MVRLLRHYIYIYIIVSGSKIKWQGVAIMSLLLSETGIGEPKPKIKQ